MEYKKLAMMVVAVAVAILIANYVQANVIDKKAA